MKKWLFQPFYYVAGAKALVMGVLVLVVTALLSIAGHTHFDGVLDVHTGKATAVSFYFYEQLLNWACMVVVFFAAGKLFSASAIRVVDIAGTMAFARWPLIFCTLAQLIVRVPAIGLKDMDLVRSYIPQIAAFGLVTLLATIWYVALLYNAFTVSCNLKGSRATGAFIGALIVAEIISKVIFLCFIY
jgi:Yip1 domain